MVEVDVEDRFQVILISVILGGFAMDVLYDIVEREANDDGLDCGMFNVQSMVKGYHHSSTQKTENWPHKKSKILNTQTPTET